MRVRLTRRVRFEAAHRLVSERLSDAENQQTYGKCSREGGHGHNYEVEVTVEGEPDPVSGLVMSRDHLDEIVEERMVSRCDHRNLNDVVDEVTTGENLARIFFEWIEPSIPEPVQLTRVRVHETPRNVFDAVREAG